MLKTRVLRSAPSDFDDDSAASTVDPRETADADWDDTDPAWSGANACGIRPKRKPNPEQDFARWAEPAAPEPAVRVATYTPSRHEAGWLVDSLAPFYEQNLISDILFLVKGGKEANVYCCCAGPAHPDASLLAAKVYRPRAFRNLRNDGLYREGRPVLTGDGRPVKATDSRILRALGKKSDFGVQVQHSSWLLYEYTTLQRLHAAGAVVPRPVAASENAVLMEFIGERTGAAPTLSEIAIGPNRGPSLFADVRRTIESLLQLGLVHGDLSAYNILFHNGRAVVIDFPQVVAVASNPYAVDILQRDIIRVTEYFSRQGVKTGDATALFDRMWRCYGEGH